MPISRRLAKACTLDPMSHATAFLSQISSDLPTTQKVDTAEVDFGPYMLVADWRLRLFSIFDDLKYDRSDADMLSPAMRTHAIGKLREVGFRQISGNVLENRDADVRCIIPKFHALGASPFDITRYAERRSQDFFLLTPTQTACQFIDTYSYDEALDRVGQLVTKQPINIYRMMDYLERKPAHEDFVEALGQLKYLQRVAVESEPLCRRRALG